MAGVQTSVQTSTKVAYAVIVNVKGFPAALHISFWRTDVVIKARSVQLNITIKITPYNPSTSV